MRQRVGHGQIFESGELGLVERVVHVQRVDVLEHLLGPGRTEEDTAQARVVECESERQRGSCWCWALRISQVRSREPSSTQMIS